MNKNNILIKIVSLFFYILLALILYSFYLFYDYHYGRSVKMEKSAVSDTSFCKYIDDWNTYYYRYSLANVYKCQQGYRDKNRLIRIWAYSVPKKDIPLKEDEGLDHYYLEQRGYVVEDLNIIPIELENGITVNLYQYNVVNPTTGLVSEIVTEFEFTYNDIYHTGDISINSKDPIHNTFSYHEEEIVTLLLELLP